MATRVDSFPPPMPVHADGPKWEPDDGMVFSTVEVRQVRTSFVAVEHPEGWTADQLSTAATKRAADIANSAAWYDADTSTELVQVVQAVYEPDDDGGYREPVHLMDADLVATAPVPVVSEMPEE